LQRYSKNQKGKQIIQQKHTNCIRRTLAERSIFSNN